MTQAFETKRRDIARERAFSRRALLQAGIATAVAATGPGRIASALADPAANPAITPFTYHAPQSALGDLKQRLAQARWPERETVADWSQGVPLDRLRALVDYWGTDYDWRRFEARLNGVDQYRTAIDGLDIHFLHVRSRHMSPRDAACFRARSSRRRAAGPSGSTPISSTGTSSIAAATSRPSSSRRCSPRNCASAFAACAHGRAVSSRRTS